MKKVVVRSEFDRYESAIRELQGIGSDSDSWLRAEPRSDKWFHYIVCALKFNTITPAMFVEMDEEPHNWCYTKPYKTWHWKLRSCRNHPEWGSKLFAALEQNATKTQGDER